MIVADNNLTIQLILKNAQTELAQAVYRQDSHWIMPELWQHEFLNVLANYLRFEKQPYEKLLLAWQTATTLFANSIKSVDMPLALKIAGEYNVTACDAQYLALAQTFQVPLITEDRKLRQVAPKFTLSMLDFLKKATDK